LSEHPCIVPTMDLALSSQEQSFWDSLSAHVLHNGNNMAIPSPLLTRNSWKDRTV